MENLYHWRPKATVMKQHASHEKLNMTLKAENQKLKADNRNSNPPLTEDDHYEYDSILGLS
jgi:hypothetical protein